MQDLVDGAFDQFVRDHFAADLAEPGEPSAERDVTVGIHAPDITGVVPAVLDGLPREFGFAEISLHDGRALDDQETFGVRRQRLAGHGIDDTGADTRHGRSDAALFADRLAQVEHGVADIDRHDRRKFGAAVTFDQRAFAFGGLVEPFGDIHAQTFRAGDGQTDFREDLRIAPAQIRLDERRGPQQYGDAEIQAGLRDRRAVERTGHVNDFAADHQRHPECGVQPEGVEDRQRAEDHVLMGPVHHVDERIDVAVEIVVGEHDALRNAGGAAGEEDERGIHHVAVGFRGDQAHEFLMRQQQGQQEHFDLVELGDRLGDVFQENHFRHRFEFDLFQEFPAGDDVGHARFVDRMAERIPAGGEVQHGGDFVRHEDADAGHRSRTAVRHHDADILAFRRDHIAEFPAENRRTDIDLETSERFASEIIHQRPERKAFRVLGQLVMERAFIVSGGHFRIGAEFGDGLPQFEGCGPVRNGVAERDRGGVGDLARNAEFQFAVIVAENTSPHHADADRDDRDLDILRQHHAVTGGKFIHESVPGDLSFREDADDFAFTQGLTDGIHHGLEPFDAARDLDEAEEPGERVQERDPVIILVHEEMDPARGARADQQIVHKRGMVGHHQHGAVVRDLFHARDLELDQNMGQDQDEGPEEQFRQQDHSENRRNQRDDPRDFEQFDRVEGRKLDGLERFRQDLILFRRRARGQQ